MNGILIVDKPEGITSFDVVSRLRKMTGERKIGHAGTLDPMATGVLPVFLGSATKTLSHLPCQDKAYAASFRLGIRTDTGDITGRLLGTSPVNASPAEVAAAVSSLKGVLSQIPPMYSAVKYKGRKLYEMARQGIEVERQPRAVTIYSARLLEPAQSKTEYRMEVSCSKGTYIRTLIEEIGTILGCGASMTALRRTSAAGFSLKEAATLEDLRLLSESGRIEERLLDAETPFLSFPAVPVTEKQAVRFQNGGCLALERVSGAPESGLCRIFYGRCIGIGEIDPEKKEIHIKCLFRQE